MNESGKTEGAHKDTIETVLLSRGEEKRQVLFSLEWKTRGSYCLNAHQRNRHVLIKHY